MTTVRPLRPPELGFYAQILEVCGVRVLAHGDVRVRAVEEAGRRVEALLGRAAAIQRNLAAAGAELHVIGERQAVTDLPMYRHMKGVPFEGALTMDERGRGYGGLHACTSEEELLRLPSARHTDHRDVCAHEVAHTVYDVGLDAALRQQIRTRHAEAVREGRWDGLYASTDEQEFFAELAMWWAGSHGDGHQRVGSGRDALRAWDPASFALVDAVWTGVSAPDPVDWVAAEATDAARSAPGAVPATLLVRNRTSDALAMVWLDHSGQPVPYGPVPPGSARAWSTWVGHVWELHDPRGRALGRWVAGVHPSRVDLGEPAV